jgi:hypothetical protein
VEQQLLQAAANQPQAAPQAQAPTDGGFLQGLVSNPAASRALSQIGLGLLGANVPSTDPRSGDIGFGLTQGIGAGLESLEQSAALERQQQAIGRQEEQRKFDNAIKLAQVSGAPKAIIKVVPDAASSTGFRFQDLNNPAKILSEAPTPGTGTTISIGAGEKEEEKALGKFRAQNFIDTQKGGKSARGKISRMEQLEDILNRIDTGALTGVKKRALEISEALGINIPGVGQLGDLQAFEALTNQVALSVRSTADGEGMPGQLSDNDIKFLKASIPNLQKTKQGNRLIIEAAKRLEQRKIAMAKLARDYRKEHKTLDEGFFDEAERFHEANPMFPDLTQEADALLAQPQSFVPPQGAVDTGKTTKGGKRIFKLLDGTLFKER